MSELVEERHCACFVFVQIGIVASHGTCRGLREEGVAHGDGRIFSIRIRRVAWLRRLLAFGIIGNANVIDGDGVVLIVAESDELGKEIVVVFVGMIFALVTARDEEFVVVVIFIYESLGFGGNGLSSSILCQDSLVVGVVYVRALDKFAGNQSSRRGATRGC